MALVGGRVRKVHGPPAPVDERAKTSSVRPIRARADVSRIGILSLPKANLLRTISSPGLSRSASRLPLPLQFQLVLVGFEERP
jgi:hypothetical protein